MLKAFRNYRDVKIYRLKMDYCNWKLNKAGEVVPAKPTYTPVFCFVGGFPYDTLEQVKEAIDKCFSKICPLSKESIASMNGTDDSSQEDFFKSNVDYIYNRI